MVNRMASLWIFGGDIVIIRTLMFKCLREVSNVRLELLAWYLKNHTPGFNIAVARILHLAQIKNSKHKVQLFSQKSHTNNQYEPHALETWVKGELL